MAALIELIDFPGIIAGVCLVAFVLWLAGVHDPFLLVTTSLIVGGAIGWFAECGMRNVLRNRKNRKS